MVGFDSRELKRHSDTEKCLEPRNNTKLYTYKELIEWGKVFWAKALAIDKKVDIWSSLGLL